MHLHDLRIGARVRQRRLELGMSQAALAKHLRLTFQQIQKYENGINRISASTLVEMARALNTPAAWFLEETSSSPQHLISAVDGLAALARELIWDSTANAQLSFANAVLGDLPLAIYLIDRSGRLTYCNTAAAQFAGREPRVGRDKWCVTWRLWERDGKPLPHEHCPMAVAMRENRAIRGASAIAERPDGSRTLFTPFPTPLHDQSGALIGGFNALSPVPA